MTAGPAATPASPDSTPMRAAPEPRGPGKVVIGGLLLGVVLIAVGVVGIREAFLTWGLLRGGAEVPGLVAALQGRGFDAVAAAVATAAVLLGLVCLVSAVRRRPRPTYRLTGADGVFLRRADAEHILADTAEGIPGVLRARARAGGSSVLVSLETTGAPGVAEQARELLTTRIAAVAPAPRIRIRAVAVGRSARPEREKS